MNAVGLAMLLALGVCILTTGLPVWALLLGLSMGFAVLGVGMGAFDMGLLYAMPARMVGVLEHDLLQALPLYVLVGVLLARLGVGAAIYDTLYAALAGNRLTRHAAPALAGLGVGAIIAPMNGSVASSANLLARLVSTHRKQDQNQTQLAQHTASLSAAATIGVVVPPSLVLLLLGDAMLRAHTEASNFKGFVLNPALNGGRIVNTQDILNAALIPAALVLALWCVIAWAQSWRASQPLKLAAGSTSDTLTREPSDLKANHGRLNASGLRFSTGCAALIAIGLIIGLLWGVFTGKVFAVEAAAMAGCALLLWAPVLPLLNRLKFVKKPLTPLAWDAALWDTLALSGALIALLLGASMFSLIFRAWGTDVWMTQLAQHSGLSPLGLALAMIAVVMLCAAVLDAFEMIFVIIPILAPVLIQALGDAQQASVLLLLALQISFLLPPMGYALMLTRQQGPSIQTRTLLWAIAPYIAAQLAVMVLVFAAPDWVHRLDAPSAPAAAAESEADIVQRMNEMVK